MLITLAGSPSAAEVETPGFLKFEWWWRGQNMTISELTNWIAAPHDPSFTSYAPSFDSFTVLTDEVTAAYGGRFTGWLTPTESGEYTFFALNAAASELWLSPTDKPADAVKIAEQLTEDPGCCDSFDEPKATGGPSYTSKPITLTAGKKYYVQFLFSESGWNNVGQVAWRKAGDTTHARILKPINAAFLSSLADPKGASITITAQPQSVSVIENSAARFTIKASTFSDYRKDLGGSISPVFLWYKNGLIDSSSTGPTYTVFPVKASDHNSKIRCVVALPGLVRSSDEATLTVSPDNLAPTITSVVGNGTFDKLTVSFSEAVDPATASTLTNYTFAPALQVTAAQVRNLTNVLLSTAPQKQGTQYTLTVNRVKDLAGNLVPASNRSVFYSRIARPGGLELQYWGDMPHADYFVDGSIPYDPRIPDSPDWTGYTTSFNTYDVLTTYHQGFATRVRGWITPTETASYRFFVRCIDTCRLYLSTDETEAAKKAIAEEPYCCNPFLEPSAKQTSEPITLTAGKSYYIELLLKVSWGSDYAMVAWRKEGDTTPAESLPPIPGNFLSAGFPAEGTAHFLFDTPVIVAFNSGFPTFNRVVPDDAWESPAFSAVGESAADPNGFKIKHIDGLQPWTGTNTALKIDGAAVTPTSVKEGGTLTLSYQPAVPWASKSVHSATLTHPDANGNPQSETMAFTVGAYAPDQLHGNRAVLRGAAAFTPDAGGRTGKPGDTAVDLGLGGAFQSIYLNDLSFLNEKMGDEQFAFSIWQKLYTVGWCQLFYVRSQAGAWISSSVPLGDDVSFDAAGRIGGNIGTFPAYSGDQSWWTNWHHILLNRKSDKLEIWIDGSLFLAGDNSQTLPSDFVDMLIGAFDARWGGVMGLIDDFAIFDKALTGEQVKALYSGVAPAALPGTPGLLAYWDFNDPSLPPAGPRLIATRNGNSVTITSDPQPLATGFVLETADSLTGPWAVQTGANTPITVPLGSGVKFLRARKP